MAQPQEPIDSDLLPKDRLDALIDREVNGVVNAYTSGTEQDRRQALMRLNDLLAIREKLSP